MKSLNLIGAETKDIEAFVLDTLENINSITVETGEYGMILFQKAVRSHTEECGFTSIETLEKFKSNQFVKYHLTNGRELLLLHNPELDNRELYSATDRETGYPVESSTLYLKE